MGSWLSAISGQFAKSVLFGTLFPVVVVVGLNLILTVPILPDPSGFPIHIERIAVGDDKWQAVFLSFVVLILTGLLYDLNNPIIRLYEGYSWIKSFTGRAFLQFEKKRLQKATQLYSEAESLRMSLPKTSLASRLEDIASLHTEIGVSLNQDLPASHNLVLPTRLGNVIRSFEGYPSQAYGMDAIALWPRLIAKIDSGFAATIDEAKTSFDFMLNMSFLCGVSALLVLGVAVAVPLPFDWANIAPLLYRLCLFLLLAIAFYYLAISRAQDWGLQVKSAFDLYRLDLLKAMAYQQKPQTYQEERAIWSAISDQVIYGNSRVDPLWYAAPATRAVAYPTEVPVTIERHYTASGSSDRLNVVFTVTKNEAQDVTRLVVIDSLPDGYQYAMDFAPKTKPEVGVQLINLSPVSFVLGKIVGENLTMIYQIKAAPPPTKPDGQDA